MAEWGTLLPDLAMRVRQAVRASLIATTELDVGEVSVVIDDVESPSG